jgi:nucleotide-binding universal stress UspA family protein
MNVVPGVLVHDAAALAQIAGWDVGTSAAAAFTQDEVTAAMAAGADGGMVLFVPPPARVPLRISRIMVPHDGTPITSRTLERADDLVAGSGAEVVALHVIEPYLPDQAGTLAAPRMLDHDGNDWSDWRDEFGRRFFLPSTGILRQLEVAVGPCSGMILRAARRLSADLLIMAWGGVLRAGRARTVRAVCSGAPCAVLLVSAPPNNLLPVLARSNSSVLRP